ncbi:hypothetical protein A3715_04370 [Oleiphilus sp. HI0009]|uniref:PilW family protein n=2 Tax=Oleiphilus TaxID=141450 RepID=UPI0007C3E97C|nr:MULTISPECIES: prepilin-type N-terminal cleavage/methylation domain-containing protein [unclassified Oleiphilus]KZX81985.1 hypothetical protein A3715_34240 [Oleiphilus sp. HI0009]KZX84183.1 hypothetical protein A3715_04370 [Oleiphilus sp. HI0009]KZY64160.1 hypothetical protein A3738_10875 [Oleiphilus sp. HI0066]KZY70333.1 hypothetical protein A3739_00710 [Oleiphilus sp. HI0067]KZZ57455.1 hypothetical protein A3762_19725 [Oleiphilus sp. HI0125]
MLSKQKGVTLIELVLAIVVGAAVIAMLIPVLKFMFSVPEKAQAADRASHKAFIVSENIVRALRNASEVQIESEQCLTGESKAQSFSFCFEGGELIRTDAFGNKNVLMRSISGRFDKVANASAINLAFVISESQARYSFSQAHFMQNNDTLGRD